MRLNFLKLFFILNCCFSIPATIQAVKNVVTFMEPSNLIVHDPNEYPRFTPVLRVYCYRGVEKALPRLFETIQLHLDIDGGDFYQYEGANVSEVITHYEEQRSLFSFTLFSQKRKHLQLTPFAQQCIGIQTKEPYTVRLEQLRIDFWRVIQLGVALLLFVNARRMSDNSFFYYITGIVLGICCSFMLLVWLTSKLLPRRSLMYGAVVGGWTVGVYIARMLWENLQTIVLTYRSFIIWYILITGLVSFFFCYRWGPPRNYRSKRIVKWVLQIMALVLIYVACSFEEGAVAIMLVAVIILYFPHKMLRGLRHWYLRRFPPKRRFLTNEEYYEQTVRETNKALHELRSFARSPDCQHWKVMQRLRNPLRFAEFVEGASHLSDEEVLSFEYSQGNEFEDDEFEDEEEQEEELRSETTHRAPYTEYSEINYDSGTLRQRNGAHYRPSPRLHLNRNAATYDDVT